LALSATLSFLIGSSGSSAVTNPDRQWLAYGRHSFEFIGVKTDGVVFLAGGRFYFCPELFEIFEGTVNISEIAGVKL
jgi:hypothetical protein